MHRMVLRTAPLLAFVIACASTAAPATSIGATTSASTWALLLGSWAFTRGCGGLAYQCRTADALGEPTRYIFRSDDSVEAYRGAALLFVAPFTVQPGAAPGSGGDERPTLLIGPALTAGSRSLLVQFQSNGTALFDEGCCDRFTLTYARDP